jgi:hypothetical protein
MSASAFTTSAVRSSAVTADPDQRSVSLQDLCVSLVTRHAAAQTSSP